MQKSKPRKFARAIEEQKRAEASGSNTSPVPELIPIRHRLSGTHTDNVGHLWARSALMKCVRLDPQLDATFRIIADVTGVQAAVQEVCKFRDELVAKLGLASPEAVWSEETLRQGNPPEVEGLWAQFDGAVRNIEILRTAEFTRRVAREAVFKFVQRHLDESWRWLVDELEDEFWRRVHMYLQGCGFEVRRELNCIEPDAPRVKHVLETRPGETVSEAWNRMTAEFDDFLAALEGPAHPKRRGRTPNRETVERNVRWFYRAKLRGESISSIAREYSQQRYGARVKDRDDRSTIYSGISRARFWLSLAPCRN